MHKVNVESFKKHYLSEVENLLRSHLDIFSETDLLELKKALSLYCKINHHTTKDGKALVVIVNKLVCGFIMYQKDTGSHNSYRVHWVVVAKNEQNKGYGTTLMHEVLKEIREDGGKHVYLETSNEKHNEHARKFYEHLGFKKIGVLPDYFDPPVKLPRKLEDGILYHKAL